MRISGTNGGNCILATMAKGMLKKGWYDGAYIKGSDNSYVIYFTGEQAEWNGNPLVLSSTRNPYEPRIFKSIDGAVSELLRLGIKTILVKIDDEI